MVLIMDSAPGASALGTFPKSVGHDFYSLAANKGWGRGSLRDLILKCLRAYIICVSCVYSDNVLLAGLHAQQTL